MNAQVCWINNCPTLLHLPDLVSVGSAEDGSARISGVGNGKTLKMGRNNLPRDLTERLKKRPDIASWFTTPAPDSSKMMIEEDNDTSKPEGVPPPANLNGYGVPSAVALVEGEHTLSTLEMWQKIEQRPQVVEALRRKIESMGGGTATRAFMENEIERRANERAAEILEQQTAPAKPKK